MGSEGHAEVNHVGQDDKETFGDVEDRMCDGIHALQHSDGGQVVGGVEEAGDESLGELGEGETAHHHHLHQPEGEGKQGAVDGHDCKLLQRIVPHVAQLLQEDVSGGEGRV